MGSIVKGKPLEVALCPFLFKIKDILANCTISLFFSAMNRVTSTWRTHL